MANSIVERRRLTRTCKNKIFIVTLCILLGLIWSSLPFFGISQYNLGLKIFFRVLFFSFIFYYLILFQKPKDRSLTSCILERDYNDLEVKIYFITYALLVYFLPFSFIGFFNVKLIYLVGVFFSFLIET
jgi:hypothetical protein